MTGNGHPQGELVPAELSRDANKRARYAEDTYFQEAYEQIRDVCEDPAGFAHQHGLVLLKPDAVVARQLLTAVNWLGDNGFQIVAARRVLLTPHTVRSLWYFQWNAASVYRRRLADLFFSLVDSLLLVVRATGQPKLPASVLVTEGKGPTDPAAREPGQLRYTLGQYSYLLNLVHTTDEPADVVRELGVCLDFDRRGDLVAETLAGHDHQDSARQLADSLYEAAPIRDLAFEPAVRRLRAQAEHLTRASCLVDEARAALVNALRLDGDEGLRAILMVAWHYGLELALWDVVVVGTSVFPMRAGSRRPLVGTVTAADWTKAPIGGDVATIG